MNVSNQVMEKIIEEEKKYKWGKEFGGYLIIENDEVKDIVFDVERSSYSEVQFGVENIMKIPEEERNKVRGWFHKHSINELSQEDVMTIMELTKFWGDCYTVVLQRNGYLLLIKTVYGTDFIFRKSMVIEIYRKEIEYDGRRKYGLINIPKSIWNSQHR